MTEKEINEFNPIIAEFDGYKYNPNNVINGVAGTFTKKGKRPLVASELKYHSDLNSLMEVVEKIRSIGLGCMITVNLFSEQIGKPTEVRIYIPEIGQSEIVVERQSSIEAVYLAVVSFINWHNQTTTDKGRGE